MRNESKPENEISAMRIMVLADYKIKAGSPPWLKVELDKFGYNAGLLGISNYNPRDETTSFGKIKTWFKYFGLAVSGVRKTKKDEVIITDNFVIGAIAAFICKISGRKRKVIALNMIAHQKGFLNKVFRKFIYNIAFKYKNFWFSVNDEDLIARYSEQFKFPRSRIFILHDALSTRYEQTDYQELDDYVFTGGDAFRDWPGFIKCAEELPDIQFIGVARHKYFPHEKMMPPNLKMYYDISSPEFYSLLKRSRIVFLPLNSMAPCGLIVMMRAALFSKPVIITETASTKNYISDKLSGRLIKMHDINEMKKAILDLNNSQNSRKIYAENLKKYLINNFSTESNAKIINQIIRA